MKGTFCWMAVESDKGKFDSRRGNRGSSKTTASEAMPASCSGKRQDRSWKSGYSWGKQLDIH